MRQTLAQLRGFLCADEKCCASQVHSQLVVVAIIAVLGWCARRVVFRGVRIVVAGSHLCAPRNLGQFFEIKVVDVRIGWCVPPVQRSSHSNALSKVKFSPFKKRLMMQLHGEFRISSDVRYD